MSALLDREIKSLFYEIAKSSELSLQLMRGCIDSFLGRRDPGEFLKEIERGSEILSFSHDQVRAKVSEVLARFQPMGADLRKLISLLEISYGLLRLGRYTRNIAQVLVLFENLGDCNISKLIETAELTEIMVKEALRAVEEGRGELAKEVIEMDDGVDKAYNDYLMEVIKGEEKKPVCAVAITLILRYLERIADHAVMIAEEVLRMS